MVQAQKYGDCIVGTKYRKYMLVFTSSVKAANTPKYIYRATSCLDWGGKYHWVFDVYGPPIRVPILQGNVFVKEQEQELTVGRYIG